MVDHLANTEINSQRIAAVESCFGASGQPLALPGRVLLGEGVLTKECRKKAKPRIFFLFNDILVYGSIVLSKRKYRSQHIIPLEEVTLEPLPETLQAKNKGVFRELYTAYSREPDRPKVTWPTLGCPQVCKHEYACECRITQTHTHTHIP